jgi:hypothetical protein
MSFGACSFWPLLCRVTNGRGDEGSRANSSLTRSWKLFHRLCGDYFFPYIPSCLYRLGVNEDQDFVGVEKNTSPGWPSRNEPQSIAPMDYSQKKKKLPWIKGNEALGELHRDVNHAGHHKLWCKPLFICMDGRFCYLSPKLLLYCGYRLTVTD